MAKRLLILVPVLAGLTGCINPIAAMQADAKAQATKDGYYSATYNQYMQARCATLAFGGSQKDIADCKAWRDAQAKPSASPSPVPTPSPTPAGTPPAPTAPGKAM